MKTGFICEYNSGNAKTNVIRFSEETARNISTSATSGNVAIPVGLNNGENFDLVAMEYEQQTNLLSDDDYTISNVLTLNVYQSDMNG